MYFLLVLLATLLSVSAVSEQEQTAGERPGSRAPYPKTEVAIVTPVIAAVLAAVIPMAIILTILFGVFLYVCKKRRASSTAAPTAYVPRVCTAQSPETLHNYYPALEGELSPSSPDNTSEDDNSPMQHPVPPYSAYGTQDTPPDYYVVTSRESPPAYRTVTASRSLIRKMVVQRALVTTHCQSPASQSALPISAA